MYKSLRPSKSFNERNVVINEEPEQMEQPQIKMNKLTN